jgi:hypothetical protein
MNQDQEPSGSGGRNESVGEAAKKKSRYRLSRVYLKQLNHLLTHDVDKKNPGKS